MKIGIITFHRAHNYGAVLQCYALQEVLKEMGHNTYVIDYYQLTTERCYKVFRWRAFRGNLIHPRGMYQYITKLPMRIERKKKFASFQKRYFHLSEACYSRTDIPAMDVYVIGSDQLWNLHITAGIDDVFLGDFERPQNSRLLSYAISGNLRALGLFTDAQLKHYLSTFETISLREEAMAKNIAQRTGLNTRIDLDPTLLTDRSLWENIANDEFKEQRYVLLYQVRRAKDDFNLLNRKAKLLARRMNCKVIDMTDMTTYSPSQFVSLFKYAQCVITFSFHATVFALIFERPLYSVLLHDGGDDRYENLLHNIGAEKLLAEPDFDPQPFDFDYTKIRDSLKKLRQSSLQYLQNI